jgi:trehalose/maltose hydrolase-like predicted phosphorylase
VLLGSDQPAGGLEDPQPSKEQSADGVTGTDEYSAIADNNVYTNLMAQKNLRAAT